MDFLVGAVVGAVFGGTVAVLIFFLPKLGEAEKRSEKVQKIIAPNKSDAERLIDRWE